MGTFDTSRVGPRASQTVREYAERAGLLQSAERVAVNQAALDLVRKIHAHLQSSTDLCPVCKGCGLHATGCELVELVARDARVP